MHASPAPPAAEGEACVGSRLQPVAKARRALSTSPCARWCIPLACRAARTREGRAAGICPRREIWGDMGRYGEMSSAGARGPATRSADTGRYGEIWGDMGRYGEIEGLPHGAVRRLFPRRGLQERSEQARGRVAEGPRLVSSPRPRRGARRSLRSHSAPGWAKARVRPGLSGLKGGRGFAAQPPCKPTTGGGTCCAAGCEAPVGRASPPGRCARTATRARPTRAASRRWRR